MSLLRKPQPDPTHVLHRENILVLDIFFEALNYETIEQKKAYEVAGLLGECWWLCWQHLVGISNQLVSWCPRAPCP